jgi:hypothetical protein
MPEVHIARALEQLDRFRIRAGLAPFDIGNPEVGQRFHQPQLILRRKLDAGPLGAIAKGGIV